MGAGGSAGKGDSLSSFKDKVEDDAKFGRACEVLESGNELILQGDIAAAQTKYEECLAIGRGIGDVEMRGRIENSALGSLGLAYHSLEQFDKAVVFHELALAISRGMGDREGEGVDLGNLGNAQYSLGQRDRAVAAYEASLAIAREIGDRHLEANSLGNLGNGFFSLGEFDKAIASHEASLPIAREIGLDRWFEGVHLHNLGLDHLHNSPPDVAAAREHLEEAAGVCDAIWRALDSHRDRASFGDVETAALVPRDLQRALVLLDEPHEALVVGERARARALAVQLARQAHAAPSESGDAQIAALDKLPRSFDALAASARDQGACTLYFSLLPSWNQLLVWVLSSKGELAAFVTIALPGKQADAAIAQLIESSARRADGAAGAKGAAAGGADAKPREVDRGLLRRCHDLIIGPIAAFLEERLIIVPDQQLFELPFADLWDGTGRKLAERHSLTVSPCCPRTPSADAGSPAKSSVFLTS